MKKTAILFITLLFCLGSVIAQVSTDPIFVPQTYRGAVKIIYDPAAGSGSMATATKCYAHTGCMTSKSPNSWSHTKSEWRAKTSPQLTKEGDMWVLNIDDLYDFYGVDISKEIIQKLCFVFHDGPDGSLEGKTTTGSDIFYELCGEGLQIKIYEPDAATRKKSGSTEQISVAVSKEAQITLSVNGDIVASANGVKLTHDITWEGAVGSYNITATAISASDGETASETKTYSVAQDLAPQPRPAGTREGINYFEDGTGATLVMYCRDKQGITADNVYVVGDFNNWTISNASQMTPDTEEGYFWFNVTGLQPNEEYAYQYDVQIGNTAIRVSDAYSPKILDPNEDKYITNSIYPYLMPYPSEGSGLVGVLQPGKKPFEWSEETLNFKPADENNLVIYEMWLYDFSAKRTIKEATRRLQYLKELGVNAVELMPVQEFDGNISWGYNPNHFFAPDKAYGTEKDYKTFIDECHKLGIAVILDVVFNHASGQHPWCRLYWDGNKPKANNPWFNVEAPHPFSVHQDFNHASPYTQNMVKRCLQYWQEEYKVDGYRLDLTKGLTNRKCNESTASNYDAERISYLKMYYDAAKEVNDDVIFILEHFCTGSEENELKDYGMRPWNNVNNAFCQVAMGWLKDGDNIAGMNKKGWISFGESHDEERNYYKALKWGNGDLQTSEAARVSRVPLTVTFGMLQPGAKMIWMYGELGFDISIEQNGRTGTKPLPENKGWLIDPGRVNAYKRCAQAIRLRTELLPEIFTKGTLNSKIGSGLSARMLKYTLGDDALTVVGNFNVNDATQYSGTATAQPFTKTGVWIEYFSGTPVSVKSVEQSVTLNPGELRIYVYSNSNNPVTKRITAPEVAHPAESTHTGLQDIVDNGGAVLYPTLADNEITLLSAQPVNLIQVFDINGRLVSNLRSAGQLEHKIDVSGIGSGMYLLIASDGHSQKAFRFIKK